MIKKKTSSKKNGEDIRERSFTWSDVAGWIDMNIRPVNHSRASINKTIEAAQRALRLWGAFPHGRPHLEIIEADIQANGGLDAYTLIGIVELAKRYEANFREELATSKKSNQGQLVALIQMMADPKQAAKASVKECWDNWQRRKEKGDEPYKGKAAFARAMLDKYGEDGNGKPLLTSQKVIEDWCREWERESC